MDAKTYYNQGLSHYLLNTPKKNVLTAFQHFEQAAQQGYADAYYFLGRFYGLGDGVTLDFNKAMELYNEGKTLGSAKCGYALAMMYHSGYGVDKDEKMADQLFAEHYQMLMIEANHGDPVSMHILGTYYYYGFHVQRYVFSAIDWLLKASNKGYSDSQYMLGMIYETLGEDSNQTEKAIPFYEKAAAQDHPYAQYALAMIALEKEDFSKAEFLLEKAALQQYALAAYSLAKLY
ncbi:MAG: tetratricopeptide repeat protein, partial [Acholeplasmataceae bacterium]